jgi:hypothetical protein
MAVRASVRTAEPRAARIALHQWRLLGCTWYGRPPLFLRLKTEMDHGSCNPQRCRGGAQGRRYRTRTETSIREL